jgi:hypothetical protein
MGHAGGDRRGDAAIRLVPQQSHVGPVAKAGPHPLPCIVGAAAVGLVIAANDDR